MKSLNDYILEKILINKDSKFDKSYINELEEDFLSITELENDKIYTDNFQLFYITFLEGNGKI